MLLGLLGIVPAIRGADEVARNAADALELRLAHLVTEGDTTVVRPRDGEAIQLLVRLSLNVCNLVLHLVRGDVREAIYCDVDIVDDHAAFSFFARRLRRVFLLGDRAPFREDYTTSSGYSSIGNLYLVVFAQTYPQGFFGHWVHSGVKIPMGKGMAGLSLDKKLSTVSLGRNCGLCG